MSRFYTNVQLFRGNIHLIGYEFGERVQKKIKYKPYFFIPTKKETKYKTVHGEPVDRIDFESCYEAREFIKKYDEVDNFRIYGLNNFVYTFINDVYQDMNFNLEKISVVTIDIEVAADDGFPNIETATKEITAIALRKNEKIIVFGCGDYREHKENVIYVKCQDEKELLEKFLDTWNSRFFSPDIVTGWNVEFFDMPYLINRIRRILGEDEAKRLSPWNMLNETYVGHEENNKRQSYDIPGISVIDYLQAYKKFSYGNQESYKLDHIAFVELGEKKIDYSEYGDLLSLYRENYQKFIEYNIHDVDLVHKLNEKLGFIEQIITIAYDSKINFSDAFTSVRMWDVIIHNHLMKKNIVIPTNFKKAEKHNQIIGAYVKDPRVGMHKWIASFDLNSLYPHLIMQYNISPETLVKFNGSLMNQMDIDDIIDGRLYNNSEIRNAIQQNDLTYTPNGCFFRRDEMGFLPALMNEMYDDRSRYKKLMLEAKNEYQKTPTKELTNKISQYHNMQLSKKIILNSAYGALSNQYFRWFSLPLAEAITLSGQLSIRWIEKKVNEYLNRVLKTKKVDYVIASDTDSIYVSFEEFINKISPDGSVEENIDFLDRVCKEKLEPYIDGCYKELADMMNAYQQKMFMKRECLANRGIWTAKKRYIMNVYNEEGVQYKEPKLKIMGIEAVRSSTPLSCRENIKKALKIIMDNDQNGLINFIEDFRQRFNRMEFEEVAFPRGVRGMIEYYDAASLYRKGTPIHVRGSLLFNKLLKQHELTRKIERIKDGDKIKFCYLLLPNPIKENVISSSGSLPKQFGLDKYIDYDTQFEKAFLDPLKTITNVIRWNLVQVSTIDDFFS